VRDEARDEESKLGLKNNGVRDEASDEERDEAREEEKSFLFGLFGRLGFRIFFFFFCPVWALC
jgi:hypothetical protein